MTTLTSPTPPEPRVSETTAERPPYLWAVATFLMVFVVYLMTLSPTTAFWDTSEYIAAAKVLGIPHPPGNPLFTLMAHAWGLLPLAAEYSVRINLFAAITSAGGAGLWFLVAERWLRPILPTARGPRLASAFAGVFASIEDAQAQMADGLGRVRIVEPEPSWMERYDELYRTVYAELPRALAPAHDALAAFRDRT